MHICKKCKKWTKAYDYAGKPMWYCTVCWYHRQWAFRNMQAVGLGIALLAVAVYFVTAIVDYFTNR